ncbi:MAG: DUF4157 domain-containing protein [Ferruginibacter sp.]
MENEFRIRENSWLARIAAKKLGTSAVAMVLGNTIHLHNVSREDFLKDEKWVKHERCHLQQYRRYGCAGFLLRYTWESIRKGYHNNRFEVEAREAEEL